MGTAEKMMNDSDISGQKGAIGAGRMKRRFLLSTGPIRK